MAEIKQGGKSVLFARDFKDRKTDAGTKLAFQVEHTIDYGINVESLITKDGNVPTASPGESTISVTSYAYDEEGGGVALWKKLHDMALACRKAEIWDVDTSKADEDGAYSAKYFRGFFSNVSEPKTAEGAIELTFDFTIEGQGVEGKEVLSQAQQDAIGATMYEYESMKALGSEPTE